MTQEIAQKMKVADHNEAVQGNSTQLITRVSGLMVLSDPEQTDSYQNSPIWMTQFTSKS